MCVLAPALPSACGLIPRAGGHVCNVHTCACVSKVTARYIAAPFYMSARYLAVMSACHSDTPSDTISEHDCRRTDGTQTPDARHAREISHGHVDMTVRYLTGMSHTSASYLTVMSNMPVRYLAVMCPARPSKPLTPLGLARFRSFVSTRFSSRTSGRNATNKTYENQLNVLSDQDPVPLPFHLGSEMGGCFIAVGVPPPPEASSGPSHAWGVGVS